MRGIKKTLFSEKGMKIVNFLFLLAFLIPNRGFIFIAHAVWIVYLGCCVKSTPSKSAQLVYKTLIVFAAVMICVNLYFLVRAMG